MRNFNATATGELDDQVVGFRAFAGDDVEAFQKEKLKDIEEELPDVERPTLPRDGALRWSAKSTPKWIIDQNKKPTRYARKRLSQEKML